MTKWYREAYPRPQLVREGYTLLNGTWDFAFDEGDDGGEHGWSKGIPTGMDIQVPFTYESEKSGIGRTEDCPAVWYMRGHRFEAAGGQRVLLVFEGVDYEATVWVNGQLVGAHTGGYARFSLDITGALDPEGNALIVVRCRDSRSAEQPRGKQRWLADNYDCWYVQTTGIWKTVWAEEVAPLHVATVKTTPDYDTSSVQFDVQLDGCRPKDAVFELETRVTFGALTIYNGREVVDGHTLSKTVCLQNSGIKWEMESWTPEHPNLYDVEFVLLQDSREVDRIGSYFGMRKISVENGALCLNNQPIYLRMVLDQGYWQDSLLTPPDEEALKDDLRKALAYGYNGVRKHQKIEDDLFYYWADVMGVYVWCEAPSTYKFTDAAVHAFTREWTEMVEQHYNHPSVITWVPFNESWGIQKVYTDAAQQSFTKGIYHLTKALDPNRPVISNDGWEHTHSDIVTLHDYTGSGEALEDHLARLEDALANRIALNGERLAFAQGHGYAGQPVMLTEFGGIAFAGEDGWGYGKTEKDAQAFLQRFTGLMRAVQSCPGLCGYCYTQLTDVQQEVNGHMNMAHQDKVDPAVIRTIVMGDEA